MPTRSSFQFGNGIGMHIIENWKQILWLLESYIIFCMIDHDTPNVNICKKMHNMYGQFLNSHCWKKTLMNQNHDNIIYTGRL